MLQTGIIILFLQFNLIHFISKSIITNIIDILRLMNNQYISDKIKNTK